MLITQKILKWSSFKNVSFVILLLKICFVFGQDLHSKKVIVIDPGHGGKDSGAIGINGVQEKEVVLAIASDLLRLNGTLFNNKMDIYLTRYGDTLISLRDRGLMARALRADVFVSLHCNASPKASRGMEVYAHSSKTEDINITQSIGLGLSILYENTKKLGFKERGVKFANFQVLRETTVLCPSLLIELGFVTNTDEAGYFLKPKNIRAMALAILMGLYDYLNTGL
jgi:N-acetylmuramoyl-L-alanine amidase